MQRITEGDAALTVRDSAVGNETEVEVFFPDGRSVVAGIRPRRPLNRWQEHFIAHGVCVDCTRNTGQPVLAM